MTRAIIFLLVAVVIVVALVLHARRRNKREAESAARSRPAPRPQPFRDDFTEDFNNPYDAKLGDTIVMNGVTYAVRGIMNLREENWGWRELLLDNGTDAGWLSMEKDPGLILVWWQDVEDPDKTPDGKTITIGDTVFTRKEDGTAIFNTDGETGLMPSGTMSYVDYKAADGRLLSFESWSEANDNWEMSTGIRLDPNQLQVYAQKSDGQPKS